MDVSAVPHVSIWSLFLQADFIVKSVMILLLLASIWTWKIIIEKSLRYRRVRAAADAFEDKFWSGEPIEKLTKGLRGERAHPMANVVIAAMEEWQRSVQGARIDKASVKQRLSTLMRVSYEREMDALEAKLGVLATVGSVAPFVGLFGTVWGIMRSFTAIAGAQNTSLTVVAPGIAEALFATAIGLFAAIPAVIAYNKLSADVGRYGGRLANFCDEFSAILSRQLDEKVH
jgi:biopolymer transport protein TolQ